MQTGKKRERNLICKTYGRHQERRINLGLSNVFGETVSCWDLSLQTSRQTCKQVSTTGAVGSPQTAAICALFARLAPSSATLVRYSDPECSCNAFPWSPCPPSQSKTPELLSCQCTISYPSSFVRPDFFASFFPPWPAIFYLCEDMTLIFAKMISTGSKTRLGIHGKGQEPA